VSTSIDILLVEDDIVLADVLRRMLIRAGYMVRIATDGIQALAALIDELPAILILDLILPGMSGFAILEQMRQHQISVPIIIITANPLYYDSLHYPNTVQMLFKPFRIEELLAALRLLSAPLPI
jgi:DNA-binding response OmpR family regulator